MFMSNLPYRNGGSRGYKFLGRGKYYEKIECSKKELGKNLKVLCQECYDRLSKQFDTKKE